jgi:hypothetical protein
MSAEVLNMYGSDTLPTGKVKVRRWSTPSYVEIEADESTPLEYYTQWCWYRAEGSSYQPFHPVRFAFFVAFVIIIFRMNSRR